jgi:hypothetical protein
LKNGFDFIVHKVVKKPVYTGFFTSKVRPLLNKYPFTSNAPFQVRGIAVSRYLW